MTQAEFGTPIEKKEFEKKEIRKTVFLDLSSTAQIRILSNSYYTEDTHYINKSTIKCLGDNCPVCANNKIIIMQNPETFRDDPRYTPKRVVYMVNVLDKTLVRTCPNCQAEIRQGQSCKKCNSIVTGDPKPSNTVKVLSRGVTLFEHLGSINNAVLDSQGERVGLTRFDITLAVNGSGKDKTITPIPSQVDDGISTDGLELFDLTKVVVTLTAEEILDLQRGVSLRDIFSARRAEKGSSVNADFVSEDTLKEVQSEVDKLFGV